MSTQQDPTHATQSNAPDDVFSPLWSVHSSIDDRPAIRAWTRSEEEALRRMEELKKTDPDAERAEYWVLRLTKDEVKDFQMIGFIPKDAI